MENNIEFVDFYHERNYIELVKNFMGKFIYSIEIIKYKWSLYSCKGIYIWNNN